MRVHRVVGAGVAGIALAGAGLLLSIGGAGAATPAPTPISLDLTGLASAACPLPLNGSLAVKPGTTVSLQPDTLLSAASTEKVTIKPAPNSTTGSKTINPISTSGTKIAFTKAGTYTLSYQTVTKSLLGIIQLGTSQTGKLVVNANAQKCVVAVSVPAPSVSVTGLDPVLSPVNSAVSQVVSGVNSAVAPVNSAVGPILGSVNEGVGGVASTVNGLVPTTKASTPSAPSTTAPGTNYKPSGPTVAQKTVPQGYGSGNGAAGSYVSADGSSINAPAIGLTGTNAQSRASSAPTVKSGGSPKTVDLASSHPRSALTGLPALAVALAIIALSGATAFYARTFLLHRPASGSKA